MHTPQTHLLGVAIRTPKTPKGKDGYHGKRTERIKFWLTDKELKQIDRKAKKLGMNRSEYIRYLIANCKLVHTPSIDYESYYNRLKLISDQINNHLIFLIKPAHWTSHGLIISAKMRSKQRKNYLTC